MKKLFVVTFAVFSTGIFAQQKNSVKVNPVSLVFGGGSDLVSYERAINEHSSIGVSAGYAKFTVNSYVYNYTGGNAFYRYYTKEVLNGFYVSGSLGVGGGRTTYTSNNKSMKDNYTAFDIGALIGYQWLFSSGFTIDVNGGASYMSLSYKEDNKMPRPNNVKGSAFLPTLGVGLGYSF